MSNTIQAISAHFRQSAGEDLSLKPASEQARVASAMLQLAEADDYRADAAEEALMQSLVTGSKAAEEALAKGLSAARAEPSVAKLERVFADVAKRRQDIIAGYDDVDGAGGAVPAGVNEQYIFGSEWWFDGKDAYDAAAAKVPDYLRRANAALRLYNRWLNDMVASGTIDVHAQQILAAQFRATFGTATQIQWDPPIAGIGSSTNLFDGELRQQYAEITQTITQIESAIELSRGQAVVPAVR